MSRGLGAIEAVRSLLPPWGVETFAALTVLDDFLVVGPVLAGVALGLSYLWPSWAGRDRLSTGIDRVRRRVRTAVSLRRRS